MTDFKRVAKDYKKEIDKALLYTSITPGAIVKWISDKSKKGAFVEILEDIHKEALSRSAPEKAEYIKLVMRLLGQAGVLLKDAKTPLLEELSDTGSFASWWDFLEPGLKEDFVWIKGQRELIMTRKSNIILLDGSIRSGKTYALFFFLLEIADLIRRVDGKGSILIASHSFNHVIEAGFKPFLKLFDPAFVGRNGPISSKGGHGMSYVYYNGIEFIFGSLKSSGGMRAVDTLKSREFNAIGVIEATMALNREDFMMLLGRVSKAPSAIVLDSNPESDTHWLYEDFINPNTRNLKYKRIFFPIVDNLALPKDYLENILNTADGWFKRRFIDGEWIKPEGSILLAFDREKATNIGPPFTEPDFWDRCNEIHVGIDWGYEHELAITISPSFGNTIFTYDMISISKESDMSGFAIDYLFKIIPARKPVWDKVILHIPHDRVEHFYKIVDILKNPMIRGKFCLNPKEKQFWKMWVGVCTGFRHRFFDFDNLKIFGLIDQAFAEDMIKINPVLTDLPGIIENYKFPKKPNEEKARVVIPKDRNDKLDSWKYSIGFFVYRYFYEHRGLK